MFIIDTCSSTLYPDVNTTSLELDCSNSSHTVNWLYNGYPYITNTSIILLTGNWSQHYGIYQCMVYNTTIALYRILPYDWTNPVTSFQLISHLPPVNFSLRAETPLYTGAVSSLYIRVKASFRTTAFDPPLINLQTLHAPNLQSSPYVYSADCIFYVTVVNSLGEHISETLTSSIYTPCMLYGQFIIYMYYI